MKQIAELFYGINEFEITINIYKRIKDQEKTDGDCYIKIAKIYDEKLDQKKEALKILKEGLDKVMDDAAHQEIELLIKKIEKEELDLILGVNDNKENECDNVTVEKQSNKEFNLNLENNSDVKDDNVIIHEEKKNNDDNIEENKENKEPKEEVVKT